MWRAFASQKPMVGLWVRGSGQKVPTAQHSMESRSPALHWMPTPMHASRHPMCRCRGLDMHQTILGAQAPGAAPYKQRRPVRV
jgi:hypothetical protein